MAAAVGIDRSEVQTEIFGDYKYFLTRNEDEDGVLLQYYIVKNGVLYMFQFNKDTDSEYYPVFENLLRTVDYPSN